MNYILIGEIVNTHGIKGELKTLSDFKFKDQVYKKNFKIYVGRRKQEAIIKSHRKHKQFDLITLQGIDDINDAIPFKSDEIYINRDDIVITDYLNEDLIDMDVYEDDNLIGKVLDVVKSNASDLLLIKTNNKNSYIPLVDEFIKNIDLENKKIYVNLIEGLINEN